MVVDIRHSTADPIAQDIGNIGVQGRVVSKTIQLSLFTLNENAVWGGRQHLLKSSYPFAMLQIVTNRRAFQLEVGDCFRFTYPKYGINGAIFRVLQKEEHELESENIVISAIEDFYSVSRVITAYSIPTGLIGPRPDYTLYPFTHQLAMEVPFAMHNESEPWMLFAVGREGQQDLGFDAYISIDNGASYLDWTDDVGNLVPVGSIIEQPYPVTFTIDTEVGFTVEFTKAEEIRLVQTTTWANCLSGQANIGLLGDEIIFFKTITPISETVFKIENIIRARMDTVKTEHPVGTKFWVLSKDLIFLNHDELIAGVNRDFKLVPYNVRRRGDISSAIPIDYTITGRWRTPYIPTNFMANGSNFAARYDDDIVLTWSPRHRGKGAGIGLPGQILAETSRDGLFEIEVWVGGAKKRTQSAIDGTTWTYTEAMNIADNGSLASLVTFKLFNYREEAGMTYKSRPAEVQCRRN